MLNNWGPLNVWSSAANPTIGGTAQLGSLSSTGGMTLYPLNGWSLTDFSVDYSGLSTNSPFSGNAYYEDIVIGDMCHYESTTTPDSHSVTMSGDGEFTIGGTLTQDQSFDFEIYDNTTHDFGTNGTVTILYENKIGGTVQLGALTSSGGLSAHFFSTLGGTSQLGILGSSGGLSLPGFEFIGGTTSLSGLGSSGGFTLISKIGGNTQLANITSTGGIDSGKPLGGASSKKKKKQKDYENAYRLAKRRKEQREAIEQSVREKQKKGRRVLRLKKKALNSSGISESEIERIAKIQSDIDRALTIEYQLQYLDFKRREKEALEILLLVS